MIVREILLTEPIHLDVHGNLRQAQEPRELASSVARRLLDGLTTVDPEPQCRANISCDLCLQMWCNPDILQPYWVSFRMFSLQRYLSECLQYALRIMLLTSSRA